MKSSSSKSWDLREGKTIQAWNPDEIFPSLTTDGMDSKVEEILRLFQPQKSENPDSRKHNSPAVGNSPKNHRPVVKKLNLASLENVAGNDADALGKYLGVDGIPTGIVLDEEHRVMAEAKRLAGETLRNAQAKAKEMLLEAKKEVDQIRQKAYDEGRSQAVSELKKATDDAQIIIDQMTAWQKETTQSNEPLIIEMVNKIARLVFGEGLTLDREVLQKNLGRVMKMAESLGDVRIYLNQQDTQILDPEWKKFQESLTGKKVLIIPSDTIRPGGCFIQGEMGVVDAKVETQLDAVFEALKPVGGDESEVHP